MDRRKPRCIAVVIAVGALMPAAALGQAAVTPYQGEASCEGAKVEVTFKYDAKAATIADFSAKHACAAGQAKGIEWSAKGPLKVEKGAFEHKDKYGNFVKGSIASTGRATGELGKPPFSLACGTKPVAACTQWSAAPAK